jgi:hypothetical protein
MIVDASAAGGFSRESINVLARSDKLDYIGRIGVFGIKNPLFRIGLEAIMRGSGRDNIQVFESGDQALAYVKNANPG